MGDGYSDKSVSPLVYTPSASNDPQATGGVYEPINDETIDAATYGATIVPNSLTWLFRKFGSPQEDSFSTSGTGSMCFGIFKTALGTWLVSNGYSRKIFRSVDNCQTWTLVYTGASLKIPVQFVQMTSGRIISGVQYSDDDGATWSVYSLTTTGSSYRNTNTSIGDGRVVITVTSAGTPSLPVIYYSDDGENWTQSAVTGSVADSDFPKTKYLGSNVWFCGGETGGFYISRDNAASWVQHKVVANYVYGRDAVRLPNGNILILHSGFGRISTNDGVSFGDAIDLDSSWIRRTSFFIGSKLFCIAINTYATNADVILQLSGDDYCTQTSLMPASPNITYPKVNQHGVTVREPCIFLENGIVYMAIMLDSTHWQVLKWAWNEEVFVDLPSVSVTSPAKLDALLTATAQLVTAGKIGTVKLYLQHTNDIVTTASSLADVAGAWTDCGALTHDTPLTLPDFTARSGEVIYPRIGFTCTDTTGISPAPELASIAFAWSSDVTAPGEPTVTRIVNTSGSSSYGYRVDFGDLPSTARHLIVEGKKNSEAYVPFNNKAQWASGTYMKFRGNRDVIEEAGERNETSLSSNTGFVENDTAQVKVAAEDDLGNRSAFVESEVITMSSPVLPSPYMFLSASSTTCELGDSITLSWDSANAATVVCDHDIGAVAAGDPLALSGSQAVSPEEDTVYTFTATSATGDIDVSTVTIDVIPATPGTYVPVLIDNVSIVVSERDEIKIEVES